MTDPVCNCPYPGKLSPYCPVHGPELKERGGSVRNLMAQLEAAEDIIPEDCICHETVVGKGECPVHGPPCQARLPHDHPWCDIGGEG